MKSGDTERNWKIHKFLQPRAPGEKSGLFCFRGRKGLPGGGAVLAAGKAGQESQRPKTQAFAQVGAGAPHNFWGIGAKVTCTNPEKGATVRTAKNQGWFWIILKISLSGGKQL